jgi:hypothetical protein
MHAEGFLPKPAKKTKVVLLLVTHETQKIDEIRRAWSGPIALKFLRMFSGQFFLVIRASVPD